MEACPLVQPPLPPLPTNTSLLPHRKERRKTRLRGSARFSRLVSPAPLSSLSEMTLHTPVPLVVLKSPGQWAGTAEDRSSHCPAPLPSALPCPALPGLCEPLPSWPSWPCSPPSGPLPHFCLLPLPGSWCFFCFFSFFFVSSGGGRRGRRGSSSSVLGREGEI